MRVLGTGDRAVLQHALKLKAFSKTMSERKLKRFLGPRRTLNLSGRRAW